MLIAEIIVFVLIGLLLILNIVASVVVWNTLFLVKARRWYQLLFIWFVPLIGAIMALVINLEETKTKKKNEVGNDPDTMFIND